MDARPDPDFARTPPGKSPRRAFRWWHALAGLGILGLLTGLLLPARRSAGPSARRMMCASNMHTISLGILGYANAKGCLPPAATFDADGRPLHSWRTLILPYIDEEELYRSIDLSKPWDDPANARARETVIKLYCCPFNDAHGTTTTYLAACGPDASFDPRRPRPLAEITDDHGSTLMVLDAAPGDAVPWMEPSDADAALLARLASAGGQHPSDPRGFNAVFVDGSSRFIPQGTAAPALRALWTIAGGETPDLDQLLSNTGP